jgi:putative ABC transport system permease protein
MVAVQSLVVGLIGYGIGAGVASLIGWLSRGGRESMAFHTPYQLLLITFVAIIVISGLASAVSIRRVLRLEPAVVFRG